MSVVQPDSESAIARGNQEDTHLTTYISTIQLGSIRDSRLNASSPAHYRATWHIRRRQYYQPPSQVTDRVRSFNFSSMSTRLGTRLSTSNTDCNKPSCCSTAFRIISNSSAVCGSMSTADVMSSSPTRPVITAWNTGYCVASGSVCHAAC